MLTTCLFAISLAAARADEIVLREGLAIADVGQRGPFVAMIDHALANFQATSWAAPKEGERIAGLDGKEQAWKPIQADAGGVLPREAYRRGWAFFEVASKSPRIMLLTAPGTGATYVDGQPRAADLHAEGWLHLPVKLKRGKTSFMFATGRGPFKAKLVPATSPAFLNVGDPTLPDIAAGRAGPLMAGIIVTNATESFCRDLKIVTRIGDGSPVETKVGAIPPLSLRKVPVALEAPDIREPGEASLSLTLYASGKQVDSKTLPIRIRDPLQTRKVTFVSMIDGSVQYYAVNPAQIPGKGKPLVLGLHGARTEGIEMADDYKSKDWCHIVCPTNRRPFGFDWEDIGRLDMLEVLRLAQEELETDPARTYLTGHSMGGHGAWINGMLFPERWAAVAPCAGWISVSSYWDRINPTRPAERAILLAGNSSETLLLKNNALNYPIYIHHGDKDEDVDYAESTKMNEELKKLAHPNVTFHTMPGAGHWFGTESIDWPGIFDLFKGVSLVSKNEKGSVDFSTVNLAASSKAWWLEILQQERQLDLSRARFTRALNKLVGTTENIAAITFEPEAFAEGANFIEIDGQRLFVPDGLLKVSLRKVEGKWTLGSILGGTKNPLQNGPFKEVFKNRFLFVFGTKGQRAETEANLSLARFNAEEFLVGGNGSPEIISDVEFLRSLSSRLAKKNPSNVVLFGNADSNAAWGHLLSKCPIRVERRLVKVGSRTHTGDDLACIFVWPRAGSGNALVGVAASTGKAGHGTLARLPFFTSGAHYPDWTVVGADMYTNGVKGIRDAGFFGNNWELQEQRSKT